jgi:hypothetical protein
MACSCFSMIPERDLDSGLAEEYVKKGCVGEKRREK